jgi:hypothetical protein
MQSYNPLYRKFIDDRNAVSPGQMSRARFYLIKEYEYVDGHKGRYSETTAPIIYTLFVSKNNPELIKRFFGKFVNEDTERLEMRGGAKAFYEKVVMKVPIISNEAYRTYKLSGFGKVIQLDMDVNSLTPRNQNVIGIDKKSQLKNK